MRVRACVSCVCVGGWFVKAELKRHSQRKDFEQNEVLIIPLVQNALSVIKKQVGVRVCVKLCMYCICLHAILHECIYTDH